MIEWKYGVILTSTIRIWPRIVLHKRLRGAGWWVLASALGWGVAGLLDRFISYSNALVGPSLLLLPTGLAALGQWLVLRRQVRQAGWWIAGGVAGWLIATAFVDRLMSVLSPPTWHIAFSWTLWFLLFTLLSGAGVGLLTGSVLVLLLRRAVADTPVVAHSAK